LISITKVKSQVKTIKIFIPTILLFLFVQSLIGQCDPPIAVEQISFECKEDASFYDVQFFLSREDMKINILHKYDFVENSNGSVSVFDIPTDKVLTIEFGDGNGCYTQREFAMPDCLEERQLTEPLSDSEATKYKVMLPNAFTPNGDGNNDYFKYEGNNIQSMKLGVFNRWGQMVYASENTQDMWDGTHNGKPLPIGIYPYRVEVVFADGKQGYHNGTITIFR